MGCAGKACGNCDTGYYQDSASQCRECPPGETHIKLLQTLAPFCAILLLVFLLMFLVVRWLELRRGTDSATLFAMKQAKEFCIWVRIGFRVCRSACRLRSRSRPASSQCFDSGRPRFQRRSWPLRSRQHHQDFLTSCRPSMATSRSSIWQDDQINHGYYLFR